MSVTRRSFIRTTTTAAVAVAAGGPGLLSGAADAATTTLSGEDVDVIVVGAGLSGLIAARDLIRSGKSVVVLEARKRVGGRMISANTISGGVVDLGGQWVGPTQTRMVALLDEMKLQRFDSYYDGKSVFHWNGQRSEANILHDFQKSYIFFDQNELPVPDADKQAADALRDLFWKTVATVDKERPWLTPDARTLDQETVFSWGLRHTNSAYARFFLDWLCRVGGSGGFEPGQASILHLAWAQAVAPQSDLPETWLIHGGAGQVARTLGQQMEGIIRLNAEVSAIEHADRKVTVRTRDGGTYNGRAVIVAIPPPLRAGIHFMPALPADLTGLIQRGPMGSMAKVIAVYPRAFWREKGVSGMGIGNLPTLELTADSSPPSGTPGILASFVSSNRTVEWSRLDPSERRKAVLDDMVAYLGAEAAEPEQYFEAIWNNEPWTTGAFVSHLTPGAWTGYGQAWRRPVGPIFWAGTDSAGEWPGYYEGAIAAAEHATRQALATL
jgi:monoamine oxidase